MNKKVLILSDKKPGHLNQSIAFCKIKGIEYDILEISFQSKFFKVLSYLCDQLNFYTLKFFEFKNIEFLEYEAIISTGSNTYYLNKVLAKRYNKKSIVLMLPKSYKYQTFDHIIAQKHDHPPLLDNITVVPLNLSFNEPKGFVEKDIDKESIGVIIGGSNDIFTMDHKTIKKYLDEVFSNYPDHLKYITTSRRTPKEIEELIEEYSFDYEVIYSKTPDINPISDFIEVCDQLFITIDSTSMLSEARANSDAKITIIKLKSKKQNSKYHKLANVVNSIDSKVDLKELLKRVEI